MCWRCAQVKWLGQRQADATAERRAEAVEPAELGDEAAPAPGPASLELEDDAEP